MARLAKITIILLVLAQVHAANTNAVDARVDPGRITWWVDSWTSRPIEVSNSNAGEQGVDFTFKFRASTSITNGYIEIHFPSAIYAPGYTVSNVWTNDNFSVTANKDVSLTISGVNLPTQEGAHGPFKFITRNRENGQIVDINWNFGYVYILPALVAEPLAVTPANTSSIEINHFTSLYFEFILDINMWRHDTFVIKTDSNWRTPAKPDCQSITVSSNSNEFKSVDDSFQLECVADSSRVYVYGLAYDILSGQIASNELTVRLRIGNYYSPKADYQGSIYSWDVEIWRWGSRAVAKRYRGNGPDTVPGRMQISDWRPAGTYNVDKIVQDLTMYTEISVTLTNTLPASGQLNVYFTNVDVKNPIYDVDADGIPQSANQYSYLEWNGNTCTSTVINEGKVTITCTGEVPNNTKFKLYTLTQFTGLAPSASAASFIDSGVTVIDTSENATITYASSSSVKVASGFKLTFTPEDGSGSTITTGASTLVGPEDFGIRAAFQLTNTDFTTDTYADISVHLPVNTLAMSNTEVYIPQSSSISFNAKYQLETFPVADSVSTNAPSVDLSAVNDKLSAYIGHYQVGLNNLNLKNNGGGILQFYNDNSGIQPLYLPMVASNVATRYEARVVIRIGTVEYVKFQRLTFTAAAFTTATPTRLCKSSVKIDFQTIFDVTMTSSARTYYLEIGFPAAYGAQLNSNLSYGDAYPFALSSTTNFDSDIQLKLVNKNNGTTAFLQITGQDAFDKTKTYTLFTAFEDAGTAIDAVSLYYKINGGDSTEYLLMQTTTIALGAVALGANNELDSTSKTINATGSITATSAIDSNATQDIVLEFPAGFSFSSPTLTGANSNYTDLRIISSPNKNFAFPTLISNGTGAASDNIVATGVITTGFESTNLNVYSGGSTDGCGTNATPLNVAKGELASFHLNPQSVIGRSWNSYKMVVEIKFTITNTIPAGGLVYIVVQDGWEFQEGCTGVGLTESSSESGFGNCIQYGNDFALRNSLETVGGQQITVTFSNVLPPINNTTSPISKTFLKSITTYYSLNGTYYTIDLLDSTTNIDLSTIATNKIEVTVPDPAGKCSIGILEAFPPNMNQQNVDLYMVFSCHTKIPAGGRIKIQSGTGSWNLSYTELKNRVYIGRQVKEFSLYGDKLIITLVDELPAYTDVELYVESAVNVPATTSSIFHISTDFSNIAFADGTEEQASAASRLIPGAQLKGRIVQEGESLEVSVKTAGEYADYTFTFHSEEKFNYGDLIWIKFPKEYDPYIGDANLKYKWYLPNTYVIDCSSEEFGPYIECIVDRWYIRVDGGVALKKFQTLSLTIHNVQNPAATGNNLTGKFEIYHTDINDYPITANRNINGVQITAPAGNISIKSFQVSNAQMFEKGDYQFEFYLTENVSDDYTLQFKLPRQYYTLLTRNRSDISCMLTYIDENDSTVSDMEQVVYEGSSCKTSDNQISLEIPAAYSFGENDRIIFRVYQLSNPEWGLTRAKQTNFSWDFEANDSEVFEIYDIWTNQYELFLFNEKQMQYTDRSFLDINATYLGFNNLQRGFTVNQYQPASETGRIQVIPGTQSSKVYISTRTGALSAKTVVFSPSTNAFTEDFGRIDYYSQERFVMYHGQSQISFQVSASINTVRGIYYIDWDIDEELQETLTDNQYDIPVKTLVEVAPKFKVGVSVASIGQLYVGDSSHYISVDIEYAPHTQILVQIELEDKLERNISIIPNVLQFIPGVTRRHFYVMVLSSYTFEADTVETVLQNLVFSISGTDAEAYSDVPNKSFTVLRGSSASPVTPLIASFSNSEPSRTGISISVTSDQDGMCGAFIAADNGTEPVQADVQAIMRSYINVSQSNAIEPEYIEGIDVEPNQGDLVNERLEAYVAFQRRKYIQAMQDTFTHVAVVYANTQATFEPFTQLQAQSSYKYYILCANNSGMWAQTVSRSFKTKNLPEVATTHLKFAGEVTSNYDELLQGILATVIGISPYRLINFNKFVDRRLQQQNEGILPIQETIYSWSLPPDRSKDTPTPVTYANLSEERLAYLYQQIEDIGISLTPSYSYSAIVFDDFESQAWKEKGEPDVTSFDSESVSVKMSPTQSGECCCVANLDLVEALTSDHVLLGVNTQYDEIPQICVNYDVSSDEPAQLSLFGLESGKHYKLECTCFSAYPMWPTSVAYSSETPIPYFKIFTADYRNQEDLDDDDDDYGRWLVAGVLILLVI